MRGRSGRLLAIVAASALARHPWVRAAGGRAVARPPAAGQPGGARARGGGSLSFGPRRPLYYGYPYYGYGYPYYGSTLASASLYGYPFGFGVGFGVGYGYPGYGSPYYRLPLRFYPYRVTRTPLTRTRVRRSLVHTAAFGSTSPQERPGVRGRLLRGRRERFRRQLQQLSLEPGPHHIEVRAQGFEPGVRRQLDPGQTTTYRAAMRPQQ